VHTSTNVSAHSKLGTGWRQPWCQIFLVSLNYFFSSHPVRFGDFNFLHFWKHLAILTSMRLKQTWANLISWPPLVLLGTRKVKVLGSFCISPSCHADDVNPVPPGAVPGPGAWLVVVQQVTSCERSCWGLPLLIFWVCCWWGKAWLGKEPSQAESEGQGWSGGTHWGFPFRNPSYQTSSYVAKIHQL